MEPRPPLKLPTAIEAKHWGAVYALYRFSNNLQLHRLLPPGPRDYWADLQKEHKEAPEHLDWQYNPDPFAAKNEVNQRQEAHTLRTMNKEKRQAAEEFSQSYKNVAEVRMATSVREMVEDVIKEASRNCGSSEIYPYSSDKDC